MRLTAAVVALFTLPAIAAVAGAAPAYRPIPTVLHVHTTWSSGNLSLEDLAALAAARGIEAVLLADNHLQSFEYGLPPLRSLLRYRVAYPSVVSNGPEAFLQAVASANARRPDVLIVPGVEVMPHYYWTGSLWDGSLTMHDGQKNILALGLYRPEDYWKLPAIGNSAAAPRDIWLAAPALLAIPGIWLLRSTGRRIIHLRYFRVVQTRRRVVPGALCLLAGALLLANNYPFRRAAVSAYDGSGSLGPYQEVIDFVGARRGVTVWSLPEARDHQVVAVKGLRATIRTDPHPADLLRTDGFTAFAGLYEDTTTFTEPGRDWDELLLQYLHGQRAVPAWAVGEAAYHYEGQAGKRLGDVQTVVLAERKDPAALLDAIRSGRAYGRVGTGDEHLRLDRFTVASPDAEPAEAGGRIALRSGDRPEVHAMIASATGRRLALEVRLIRSGAVIQTLRGETPLAVRWTEPPLAPHTRLYYRLEARGPAGLRLLSNPIFAQASQE